MADTPPIKAKGLQALNPKVVNYIRKLNLQQKSRWDFLIFRTPFDTSGLSSLSNITDVVGLGTDLLVSKIFVQSITFPVVKPMYERVNGDVYVKDIEYPEAVTLRFIDDERGLVMRYIQEWFQAVMVPASTLSTKKGYIFKDNQEGARRTGILLLAGVQGKFPSTYPRITFYGMVPRDIADITVGQEEKDNLTYDVTFSIRESRITSLV